jgi:hypothetical protein
MLEKPKKVLYQGASISFYTKASNAYVSFCLLLEEAVTKLFIFFIIMTSGRKDEI